MLFVDEATIHVEAGRGGKGACSFRREKYVPLGGPDGGNGGAGGDVVLVADAALNTLVDLRYQAHYRAEHGEPGHGKNMTGRHGEDLVIRVPVGTTVVDDETLEVLGDLAVSGARLVVAKGGQPGFGNTHYKSSTNRAPRRTTPGFPGESRRLRLQLKVLADVGLLGMPNAGKSTLLARVSASRPKIADYPFTTLTPNLGVVRLADERSFVMADIPGLIEGAADGAGLGTQFLRHLARCRVLLHLVEVRPLDGSDPVTNIGSIDAEVARYSATLLKRSRWLVLTKTDLIDSATAERIAARVRAAYPDRPVYLISAATGQGIGRLLEDLMTHVETARRSLAQDAEALQAEAELQQAIGAEVLEQALARRRARDGARADEEDAVEVIADDGGRRSADDGDRRSPN
jgi:GTP-binding protein